MQITSRQVPRTRTGFHSGLGELAGAWGAAFALPAGAVYWDTFPSIVPPAGFKEKTYTIQYGTGLQQQGPDRMVTPTIIVQNMDRGGGTRSVPNPHYAPPAATLTDYIMQLAASGKMKVTLPPLAKANDANAWNVQRASIPAFSTYIVGAEAGQSDRGGVYGAKIGKVYVTNAQAWLNLSASNQYGVAHGWIGKKDWMDRLSDGVALAVQIVVIAGISVGVASAFGVGPLAQPGSAAGQASAAASDAGFLPPPAQAALVPAGSSLTAAPAASIATQAASGAGIAPAASSLVSAPAVTSAVAVAAPSAASGLLTAAGSTLATAGAKLAQGLLAQQIQKLTQPKLPQQNVVAPVTTVAPPQAVAAPGSFDWVKWTPALTAAGILLVGILAAKSRR